MSAELKSILGAASSLPVDTVRKLLGKFDPSFNNYFAKSAARGIDSHRALSYLENRFGNKANRDYENQLDQGSSNNSLRPDEMVSRSEVGKSKQAGNALKLAGSAAIGLGGGAIGRGLEAATSSLGDSSQGRSNIEPEPTISKGPRNAPSQGDFSLEEQGYAPSNENPLSKEVMNPPHSRPQKPSSVLGRASLEQQASAMADPQELLQAFEQLAQHLQDPVKAAGQLATLPKFRDMIAQIEKQSGMSFLDWAVNEIGKTRQPQQQSQQGQQQGNPQAWEQRASSIMNKIASRRGA